MTPFFSRTELAWTTPLLLTVCACKRAWPASATIRPWLSTLPDGRWTGTDKLSPSGRSERSTSWPASSAAVPPGAAMRTVVLDLFRNQKQGAARGGLQMPIVDNRRRRRRAVKIPSRAPSPMTTD